MYDLLKAILYLVKGNYTSGIAQAPFAASESYLLYIKAPVTSTAAGRSVQHPTP